MTRERVWPRIVVLASVPPFAGIGVAFLVAPAAAGALVGLELTNVTADNDVRAVYGGLSLGCAAFLLWCGLDVARLEAGVRAQVFTFGGLAGARFVSIALHGLPEPLGLALHAAEIVGLACGVSAWLMLRSGAARGGAAA